MNFKNLALGYVATAPSPATTGTSLTLDSGEGARFPQPSTDGDFYVTAMPPGENPHVGNSEILKVTARSTDTLTITREQGDTTAKTIEEGWIILQSIYKENILDEDDMASNSATSLATQQSIVSFAGAGWIPTGESWSYSAWDDTNGVSTATITVPSDATTKYQPGMRVKFTQPTDGVKYGIITKVTATALTVFMNTDYDFDDEAITSPYYSPMKAPFGFDLDPDKWKVEFIELGNQDFDPPDTLWHKMMSSHEIDIPVGKWWLGYQIYWGPRDNEKIHAEASVTLSTSSTSESDGKWTSFLRSSGSGTEIIFGYGGKRHGVSLTSKETRHLLFKAASADRIYLRGGNAPGYIRAECAYL